MQIRWQSPRDARVSRIARRKKGTAFDLWFAPGEAVDRAASAVAAAPRPTAARAGWIGSAGPGIDPATWPRGTQTGLPMFHALTLLLPLSFQRRGPDFPAVSIFQGEGQFAAPRTPSVGDPFEADIADSRDHPQLARRSDALDGQFALVWLTQAEFDAGPTAPPLDTRRPGEHTATDEGPNAWDTLTPTRDVRLRDRLDPNAGHVPVDPMDAADTRGYVSPITRDFEQAPWAQILAPNHLGGTCQPVQSLEEGFTPYYLELEELPGLNFGGGNAQIDLESGAFDWACC